MSENTGLTISEKAQLEHHELVIERGLQTFVEVGQALLAIRDGRLYRQDHATFEDYCRDRWGMERRHAYRLIDAAGVVENVSHGTHLLPANERQARPLTTLEPGEQREAWQEAVETAPNGRVTAKHVEAVVERRGGNGQLAAYERELEREPDHECTRCREMFREAGMHDVEGVWFCGSCFDEMQSANGAGGKTTPAWYALSGDNEGTVEWYTPEDIVRRARQALDVEQIGLDPCSTPEANQVVQAARIYTVDEDGLAQPWRTKSVYLNPPYGRVIGDWIEKLVAEYAALHFDEAVVLVPARTDTQWWQLLNDWPRCFVEGRLEFWGPAAAGHKANFPSAIFGINVELDRFVQAFGDVGSIYVRVK